MGFHTFFFMLGFKNFLLVSSILALLSCSGSEESPAVKPEPVPPTPPPQAVLTEAELMDKVQRDVLRYFWEYAHPESKLARERYHVDNPGFDASVLSAGGSGFGMLNILVGIKNGYVPRSEAVARLTTALTFLQNADRFHGAWPHWINGSTGKVLPFSAKDDGGDLVETAFIAQGLIAVREYFKNSANAQEKELSEKADTLWRAIEWNFYTQGKEEGLYWHWSPNYGFEMNMKLQGFDETLVTYILAASSPEHSISKVNYERGWARSGAVRSASSQYGIPVLAQHNGQGTGVGPLFWSHYSFLCLNPMGLQDAYLDYGKVTTNHAQIQYQYALANPKKWKDYGAKHWGLTASYSRASDGGTTYNAHSPQNDLGVISPTAALSSMPFTPKESMQHLRMLYEERASSLVGVAGPYDAYAPHYNWVANRYLAIDQGTIGVMVENHKSSFLWDLFMNAPEIKLGLKKLGFTSSRYTL